jgi:hypothetical protein
MKSDFGLRNVFLINSYLTYLVARLVLEKERYQREQSVFFFFRGVQPLDPTKYIPHHITSPVMWNNMPEFPTYNKFYKGRRLKAGLFRQIRSFTEGNDFKLHTFQTTSRVVQLIRSMPECVCTNILEEGICVYKYTAQELAAAYRRPPKGKEKFQVFLNYGDSIKNPGFIESGLHCYCLYEDAFRGNERKTPLFDAGKVLRILQPRISIPSHSIIFVHTWFDEQRQAAAGPFKPYCAFDVYVAMVCQMARNYSGRQLFHRFHPAQSDRARNLIRKRLEAGKLEINELPETEPIESYVFSPQPFTFIGLNSSVFHYAKRMGKEVIAASE